MTSLGHELGPLATFQNKIDSKDQMSPFVLRDIWVAARESGFKLPIYRTYFPFPFHYQEKSGFPRHDVWHSDITQFRFQEYFPQKSSSYSSLGEEHEHVNIQLTYTVCIPSAVLVGSILSSNKHNSSDFYVTFSSSSLSQIINSVWNPSETPFFQEVVCKTLRAFPENMRR